MTSSAPDEAEESQKVRPASSVALLVAMVVLEAVAGITLAEASSAFLRPVDHPSQIYKRDQTKVALQGA
jgi:hypothetical protein